MIGPIASGTLLVLISWVVALVAMTLLGMPLVLLAKRTVDLLALRAAMWTGLLVALLVILATGIVVPLRSSSAAIVMAIALAVALACGVVARPRWVLRADLPAPKKGSGRGLVAVVVAAGLVTVCLAIAALGPVTNYDSGLYHLGAIAYAGEFRTIPGLANVYQAFGYNTSQFPFGAFLGNGPWQGQGYRLGNGLIVTAMSVDLVLRIAAKRRTLGTSILLVGALAAWVPLVALSDFLVTSPTSDSVVMVLSLVALAYLADALRRPTDFGRNASVAFVLGFLAFTMRPTMGAFLLGVVLVIIARGWRIVRSGGTVAWPMPAAVALLAVVGVLVQTARDYLLSGWLQYPLSVWKFDVAWRAIDPVTSRDATLGAARNPFDFEAAAHGWSWIGPWLIRVPLQWGIYEFTALVVFAVTLGVLARRRRGTVLVSRSLLLLMVPCLIAVAAWWTLSPPSFRFIWGPLFGLAVVPAGWYLHALTSGPRRERGRWSLALAGSIALAVVVPLVAYGLLIKIDTSTITEQRTYALGPLRIGYAMAPIPVSDTVDRTLASGLVLRQPTPTDQCWGAYPLCTPLIETDVAARGQSIQDGFIP